MEQVFMLPKTETALAKKVRAITGRAISNAVSPGFAIGIFSKMYEEHNAIVYAGNHRYPKESSLPVSHNTWYDIASNTKAIVNLATLKLSEQGKLSLNAPVGKVLGLRAQGAEKLLVRHLMTFSVDFDIEERFTMYKSKEKLLERVARAEFRFMPGEGHVYRDMTTILLGMYLERTTKKTLSEILHETLFDPLELRGKIVFQPKNLGIEAKHFAPSERANLIRSLEPGIVHDETAGLFLPQNVGCAGLFATLPAMMKLFQAVIDSFSNEIPDEEKVFQQEATRRLLVDDQLRLPGHAFSMGFDKLYAVNPGYTPCECFNKNAIVFTGFTGCSVMIDPVKWKTGIIILSNRNYPKRRKNTAIKQFRKEIANAVISFCKHCNG